MKVINATYGNPVYIGHEDDNEAICVKFDVSHLIDTLGDGGEFYLRYKRPTDPDAYPITPNYYSVIGDELTWVVSDSYLVGGVGKLQIRYVKDESSVMSDMYVTVCRDSLGSTSDIPEPVLSYMEYLEGLLSTVISKASETEEATHRAEQAADTAMSAAEDAADAVLRQIRIEGHSLVIGRGDVD